jgi:aerobic C4-dicarboxylate transport protein
MGCSKIGGGLSCPRGVFIQPGWNDYLFIYVHDILAQAFNVHLSAAQILSMIGILMVTSKRRRGRYRQWIRGPCLNDHGN